MKIYRDYRFWAAAALATAVAPLATAQQRAAMVRMARVSYVQGGASWRPSGSVGWSHAAYNVPVRQGGQFWAPGGARAELTFDDGSAFRMTNGGYATLSTMYSDTNGEYTNIGLKSGASYLRIRHPYSVYQCDTPYCSIRATGPAAMEVWNGPNVQVACTQGTVQCDSPEGKYDLKPGDDMVFGPNHQAYRSSRPAQDDWSTFNSQRDAIVEHPEPNVPSNVGLVSGELDSYGSWRDVPHYGHVWYPRHHANWRPYHDGHWTFVDPVGWTWVADEPWGWAPYHYGTWVSGSDGWGWVPGPASQYWSPAVVGFSSYNGYVAWAPLAPAEVMYPASLTVGFGGGNWGAYFSIGGVADYYPGSGGVCVGRPFDPYWVNSVGFRGPSFYASVGIGGFIGGASFVPVNSYAVEGASYVRAGNFGGGGGYGALGRNGGTYFRNGHSFAPRGGGVMRSAPLFARPTMASITPNRSFVRNPGIPRTVAMRTAYHTKSWSAPGRPVSAAPMRGSATAMRGRSGNPAKGFAGRTGTMPRTPVNNRSTMAAQAAAARNALHHAGTPANRVAANRAAANRNTAARALKIHGGAAPARRATPARPAMPSHRATPARPATPARRATPARHAAPARRATPARPANPARRAAPARRATPAHRAAPARRAAPAHRSAPVRTLRPARSAPAQRRSSPAPRSAPRQSAPRAAPRGGGGQTKRRGGG